VNGYQGINFVERSQCSSEGSYAGSAVNMMVGVENVNISCLTREVGSIQENESQNWNAPE
jgi:hypothetical protein